MAHYINSSLKNQKYKNKRREIKKKKEKINQKERRIHLLNSKVRDCEYRQSVGTSEYKT